MKIILIYFTLFIIIIFKINTVKVNLFQDTNISKSSIDNPNFNNIYNSNNIENMNIMRKDNSFNVNFLVGKFKKYI